MFSVRSYHQGNQLLVAACDPELLGTLHTEGKFRLDVSRAFYEGPEVGEEELRQHLGSCTVANLVGEATISVALNMGLVQEAHVRRVEGIPHAQMVTI